MKVRRWIASVLVIAAVGCSKAPVADTESPASPQAPTVAHETPGEARTPSEDRDSYRPTPVVNTPAAVLPVSPTSTAGEVVTAFLDAMKEGNEGVTAGLLTTTAREETGKHGLAVQPPGSPSAKYQVAEAEISSEDPTLAQVACVWTELDGQGVEQSEQVWWVLRKETAGWRVCGMATHIPTRQEPVFFDFEDPNSMEQLDAEIREELYAAQQGQVGNGGDTPEARTAGVENGLRK